MVLIVLPKNFSKNGQSDGELHGLSANMRVISVDILYFC